MTKLIATISLGSMVESCSGAGKVAIGKAEKLWFSNRSAGGRGPMMMFDDCKCMSSPVVTFSCWFSKSIDKRHTNECNEEYRIQM